MYPVPIKKPVAMGNRFYLSEAISRNPATFE
jgi:hypothetical protein